MTPASVGFQCPECVREGQASVRHPRQAPLLRRAGRRFGAVTVTLIGLNVAVFVATAVSAGLAGANPLDNQFSPLFARLAQIPVLVELGEDWRLVTAAFLHIGLVHLALNMLALLVFGSELERQLGRWRYLAVYLVSLLGGAVALQLFGEPARPIAGASAAIYGLLGGLAVLMMARREDLRGLLTLLAINVVISFLPGVSLLGHLGGLLAGFVATGLVVLARRRTELQVLALMLLGAGLVVVALTVPTIVVL
ncbi:rhomboid family intramembrane serine protease [Geodermatophilus sp. TF02-6]|uniref:rhomboid family intramembrane serine protease n=1 Tax=Geodermatophilus sp. TF02-6 TaxID=2250575 RepID=UPI000DEBC344|nr:rhomboid family intramembrane serine protease [Geodermatophilus sp. TF02-6]RBY80855.1 rhomboid family intramembrane serine protease [Geodermatophilus sp. TF02-6]